MNRLFVGNLSHDMSSAQLSELFDRRGARVLRAWVAKDRANGRPRGFGFVDLSSPDDLERAIDLLDGLPVAGRALVVREAGPWVSASAPVRPPRRRLATGEVGS